MGLTINRRKFPDPREVKRITDRLIEAENEVLRLRGEFEYLFSKPEEEASRGTLVERIVELLNAYPSQTYTAPQVTHALNANPNSVGPLLSRLVAENKIQKIGHGEYQAVSIDHMWEKASVELSAPSYREQQQEEGPETLAG